MLPRAAHLALASLLLFGPMSRADAPRGSPSLPSASPSKSPGETGADLRADARLYRPLTVSLSEPTVEEVLEQLREATGVSLSIDSDNVETKDPAFFNVRLHNMPAWAVMQQLARSKVVEGKWVEAGEGYQLVGTVQPRPVAPPAAGLGVVGWMLLALGLVLALLIGWFLMRVRRTAATATVHLPKARTTTPAGAAS